MMFFVIYAGALVVLVVSVTVLYKKRHQKVTPGFKAVLITGCDRGFGYLLAKRLDESGYKVFAGCLDASCEGSKSLRRETSSKLELLQLDVTNEVQIETARATVAEMLMGHMLWAVVNNAGVGDHAWFEWNPKASFKKLMDVNFMGVVDITRAFLPLVRASKGRIINMSSMAGRTALPGFTAYASTKFAVIAFSESLRREMYYFGVKVITVEPSLYKTGISDPDTVFDTNENLWHNAEPGIKRDYGESYFRNTQVGWKRLLRFGSDNINQAVDCYVDAVTSSHPRDRYAPPFCMGILNDAFNLLSYSLQDAIIRRVLGITAKPDMLSPSTGENFRTGRRRSYAN